VITAASHGPGSRRAVHPLGAISAGGGWVPAIADEWVATHGLAFAAEAGKTTTTAPTIKADTKSGLYWGPESDLYDHIPAEIYFVNEQLARANGFVEGD